jgi:hypothetical protein
MSITLNPNIQTNAVGSFVGESDGLICGTAWPDPAARFALSGGILDDTEVMPIWGGVAVTELVPGGVWVAGGPYFPRPELGGRIKRATSDADLHGFAVFDQNYAAVNTPQSPVPQTAPGGFVSFYRLGCGIRIAVEMDPGLVVEGQPINTPISWDFTNNYLTAGGTALPIRVLRTWAGNCMAPLYDGGPTAVPPAPGFLTWNRDAAGAIILL